MQGDLTSRDRAYAALRRQIAAGRFVHGERIDLQTAADDARVSVTPVREALFQLVGEGVVQPNGTGGFHLHLPNAAELRTLYAWYGQHLNCAVTNAPEPQLHRRFRSLADMISAGSILNAAMLIERLAHEIGSATSNSQYLRVIASGDDWLRCSRRAEPTVFNDVDEEMIGLIDRLAMASKPHIHVYLSLYHQRRIKHAGELASSIRYS